MLSNTQKDERNRILQLVESDSITASEAAQLLDALEREDQEEHSTPTSSRVLRIRVTSLNAKNQRVFLMATLPVSLIRTSLRLGIRLVPQLSRSALEDLLQSIDVEASGRLLDLQDMERGERLEIFIS
jgi:hypothetical protein